MWRVERKESSGKASGVPAGTRGSGTPTTPALLWQWGLLDAMDGRVGKGQGRVHDVLRGVLYSFDDRGEGMVMRVAN